jgi:predicted ArsR family transcriptional regulator
MDALKEYSIPDTRRKILELLKKDGPKTTADLSKSLNITAMGVRQQLNMLERDGLVEYRVEQKRLGRPSHLFLLTELGDELFPRTYPQFANSLLETLRFLEGEKGIKRLFEKRTALLERQYQERLNHRDLEHRVSELARIRTEEGYMAEWSKQDKNTFLLRENNCAICQIARKCIQACDYELKLFQKALPDAEITRETHILNGDRNCTYRIRQIKGSRAKKKV